MQIETQLTAFLPDIRALLRDPVEVDGATVTPHYADALLLKCVVEAFSELWKTRPASKYVDGRIVEQTFSNLATDTIVYDNRWWQGVVYHATALVYETGTPDTVNAQFAQQFRALARNEFLT